MIDLEITSACAYPHEYWLIMGTQGTLAGGAKELRWKYFNPEKLPKRRVSATPDPNRAYNKEDIPWKKQIWKRAGSTSRDPNFYNDVYKTIRQNKPLYITPESVRRQIALIQKCHKMCPV